MKREEEAIARQHMAYPDSAWQIPATWNLTGGQYPRQTSVHENLPSFSNLVVGRWVGGMVVVISLERDRDRRSEPYKQTRTPAVS